MNELLKKLLEAEILSEASKKELEGAFQLQIEKVEAEAREEVKLRVETELKAQWITDRDALIEALDAKINDYLLSEMEELRGDIAKFRDLEAEAAANLVEAKQEMAEQLRADVTELVEKLDSFLDMRLKTEFEALRTDIREAKKLDFGRKVFEAFLPEYRRYFVDANATERELQEAKVRLNALSKKYKNVKGDKDKLVRKVKMEQVLSPLLGKSRDIMETILKSVDTNELDEAYAKFISRVIKESNTEPTSAPATVTESATKTTERKVVVKSGDTSSIVTESVASNGAAPSAMVMEFKRLAGMI